MTGTGVIAGTPKYLAPGSILRAAVTACSDIYGLGAVLYFLLTGGAPFEGSSTTAVSTALLLDDVIAPSIARGEPISSALESVVLCCLSKEPEARFADAGELARASRLRSGEASTGATSERSSPEAVEPKTFDPDAPTISPIALE